MKYVLDASVAIKWVLPESGTVKARDILSQWQQHAIELIVPDFFPVECGHAIFRAGRKKVIATPQCATLLASLLYSCPKVIDSRPLISQASVVATKAGIGFYDAMYIALAEHESCQLITADAKLVAATQSHYGCIIDLAAVP